MNKHQNWNRDELILVLDLYCRIPFGRIHSRNPEIIELSQIINRTPSAVSLKMANFASLDTSISQKGMSNASKLDRIIWDEFQQNSIHFFDEVTKIQSSLTMNKSIPEENITGEDIIRYQKTRKNQNLFRQMILISYNYTCAITGIDIPDLLVASHIIPWSQSQKERLNPCNGICLNALHDKAFDRGLISFDANFRLILSPRLTNYNKIHPIIELYNGKELIFPYRFLPSSDFLRYHRENIFQS